MRIGVDLGGTKIEIIALDDNGNEQLRERRAAPRHDYDATISAIRDLVCNAEERLGITCTIGIGIPGTISASTGLVKNANSTWLNGHPFDRDIGAVLNRKVRTANDANCFALSESKDGAGKGQQCVFGVIAGTGVGSGICISGQIISGAHAIGGEWGHNPLPWPKRDELPGTNCYCGKQGCIETWCSGPALERQFFELSGKERDAKAIAELYDNGDNTAKIIIEAFFDRMARALAGIVNVLDPDIIVLGGGLSNIDTLYTELPSRILPYTFHAEAPSLVVKNHHGDSSGVRGAAWLWGEHERSGLAP
ncbi:MAG TPA: ROK family protein [Rhizomicrobium sp.]|nr:ROK family protein [Rhizomicrobium sp.]